MTFLGQYDADTGEQIKKNLDEDYAAEKGRRERETQSKLAGLGKGYEDREREIARDRDAVLGGLDQAKREETDRRHAAYAKQLQASQAAVDAARKEFDDARKEAADKRAAKERADREADYAGKRDFSAMDGHARGQDQRRRHLQRRGRLGPGLRRRRLRGNEEPAGPHRRQRREAAGRGPDGRDAGSNRVAHATVDLRSVSQPRDDAGDKPSIDLCYIILGTSDDTRGDGVCSWPPRPRPTATSCGSRRSSSRSRPTFGNARSATAAGRCPRRATGSGSSTPPAARRRSPSRRRTSTTTRLPARRPRTIKGAIGVTDDSVEGCEIVVPQFKWTETHQLDANEVTWDLQPDALRPDGQDQRRRLPRLFRRPGALPRRARARSRPRIRTWSR